MAIKIIKFDLPINGTKVTTLDELRDNLTDEIVALARSGQLERWFKSRQLPEQAQAVASAVSQNAANKALFLALCTVLDVEVHPDDVNAIFDAPPQAGWHAKRRKYCDLCEELKKSHETMREKAKNRITELQSVIEEIFTHRITGKLDFSDFNSASGITDRYMPVKFENPELRRKIKEVLQKKVEI